MRPLAVCVVDAASKHEDLIVALNTSGQTFYLTAARRRSSHLKVTCGRRSLVLLMFRLRLHVCGQCRLSVGFKILSAFSLCFLKCTNSCAKTHQQSAVFCSQVLIIFSLILISNFIACQKQPYEVDKT